MGLCYVLDFIRCFAESRLPLPAFTLLIEPATLGDWVSDAVGAKSPFLSILTRAFSFLPCKHSNVSLIRRRRVAGVRVVPDGHVLLCRADCPSSRRAVWLSKRR